MVISEMRPLPVPPGGTVLLEAANKPILVVYTGAERRVVALGFDPVATNLPLTITFPILMANMLHWLTPQQSHERVQLLPGEPLHWSIPASLGLTTVTITNPYGITVTMAVADQELIFDDTTTVGVYTVRGSNYDKKFVVNLFDEREASLQPIFFSTTAEPARLVHTTVHQEYVELWPYLLWAALLLLMVE